MRIVDRKTFLAMPIGTVYSKMPLRLDIYDFGPLEIKGENCGNDWFAQRTIGDIVGANDSEEWFDAIDQMRNGFIRFADYDIQSRDGFYNEDQTFAVLDRCDVEALILRLTKALRGME